MKPAWDKLMKKYADHKTILVADVDCTAGGKDLCEDVGVQGFPTIKYGDPSNLEDYEGGRDLKALQAAAKEKDDEMKAADKEVEDMVKGLQASYEAGQKKEKATKQAIKEAGLGLMKSVRAHRQTAKSEL